MAPFPSPSPIAARSTDDQATALFRISTIALAICFGAFFVAGAVAFDHFIRRCRELRKRHDAIKRDHDQAVAQNVYFSAELDKLQQEFDALTRLRRPVGQHPREPYFPPSHEGWEHENPFIIGPDESEEEVEEEEYVETPVVSTATAQVVGKGRAKKTSVSTDGTSPRQLVLTPGSSYDTTARGSSYSTSNPGTPGKSMVHESPTPARQSTPEVIAEHEKKVLKVANADEVNAGPSALRESSVRSQPSTTTDEDDVVGGHMVYEAEDDEDDRFSNFSGIHSTPSPPRPAKVNAGGGHGKGGMKKYQATVENVPPTPPTRFTID